MTHDNAAAFEGSYCDLKFVKTRSVLQVIIELPIEQGAAFVAAFGAPQPKAEIPVAIARLDLKKAASEPAPAKERRKFGDLPIPTRVGIVCNEPIFWHYLTKQFGQKIDSKSDAAEFIRFHCGVQSRSEIKDGTTAYMNWHDLFSDYELYKSGQPF